MRHLRSLGSLEHYQTFCGTINFGTFVAAFLCDTYFGRYKTLSVAVIACFLGSFVILLTAAVPQLHPAACGTAADSICNGPSGGQIAFLLMGLGFLDKAAILTPEDKLQPDGKPADPWKLCTMQQVEEVKCIVRVLPIWFASSIYYLTITQQMTYPVFQALQSDRRLGSGGFVIPAATYVVFLMTGMTVFIVVYDRVLVPTMRRITGLDTGITLLQRIGTGIFFATASLVVAGFVEERRRTFALTKPTLGMAPRKGEISSMSAMWLIPQLSLAGVAEAFAAIGQMEFYYKQFPENMRSFAGSIFYVGGGVSSYLGSFLIATVHRTTQNSSGGNWLAEDLNKGRLDLFYFMIAGILAVNFAYFLVMSRWYRYKGSDDEVTTYETNENIIKQQDKNVA
ncbi:unnamed protein product [Arabidopsis thaliana]|uniref:(thale cress) hypothetical protein n=1 Tax=Arabidopsis thaliana TaxID=3702 RepID=A0A7G2FK49_ARATH|nr:unnamed protein product [Arabidopsis thaliana]